MQSVLYVFLLVITIISSEECEEKIENHLGTKSPYRLVANKNYTKDENIQGCFKKIWMITRHGTRFPSSSLIQSIEGHLSVLRDIILHKNVASHDSNLVKSDIDLFDKWRPRYREKDHKKLTTEGEYEMLELAERMQARFPDLLPPIYSDTSYKFKFTKTQRTKRSAQSFVVGLFDKRILRDVSFPEPLKQDPILRFYKLCQKWKTDIKYNGSTYNEGNLFEKSQIMNDTLKKITKKLNLDNLLSFSDARLMYTTCAFETSWPGTRKSPWCVPFDLDTIKVMEYAEDLKYYWPDGYGHELTYKQACITFNNMLKFLLDENTYPKATFYFSHSGVMLKFLSHLGLYKDENIIKHDNYVENLNRKWRVSKIDSFGTNLAFILYKCNNEKKLLVLHNEFPVRLPCCPDSDLCDLETVEKYYDKSINECTFDEMCENVLT